MDLAQTDVAREVSARRLAAVAAQLSVACVPPSILTMRRRGEGALVEPRSEAFDLTAADVAQATSLGRNAADLAFDYTRDDAGWAEVLAALRQVKIPKRYPPKPLSSDVAIYRGLSELAAHQDRRSQGLTWAAGIAAVIVVVGAGKDFGASSAVVPAILAAVGVFWTRNHTMPEAVPEPPLYPDKRQIAFASAWADVLVAAAAARHDDLEETGFQWSLGQRPEPLDFPMDYMQAETRAGAWMTFLGATGVVVSQATRDGGIDVAARGFVAQVKWQAKPVSPAPVQQILGVAHARGARAVFFAGPKGYSRDAIDFATSTGILLFVMGVDGGSLQAASDQARLALADGLPALWRTTD